MSIRWDPFLVRGLAAELDTALAGARLRALRLDARSRVVALLFRDRALVWRLHPDDGIPLLRDPVEPRSGDLALRGRVRSVRAPTDERLLTIEVAATRTGQGPWEIVVELMGNQLNAIVTEGEARTIRHLLRRREGSRPLAVGRPYTPPAPTQRLGADGAFALDDWLGLLEPVPPGSRARELVRNVAWTSPLNSAAFLDGDAPPTPPADALRAGHAAWRRCVTGASAPEPCVLHTDRGPQPYPFRLTGRSWTPVPSLLDAFERAASDVPVDIAAATLTIGPELLARLEDAIAAAERRVVRLQAELDEREDPREQRAIGDLLLARFRDVPRAAEAVTLVDFEGRDRRIELDPKLEPNENAARYYDRAQRAERIAERLPRLIERATGDRDTLVELLHRARDGEVEAEQVDAALPRTTPKQGRESGPALPYRAYRSSGGLEIRVGRGARHNDDLTFRHSAPGDVWMHARHVAGAHVILRWPHEGSPPARDLHEAAVLAALHSRARTSGSVPVDWTLRKYVRKPRGAAPGSVVPDRVRTVFVQPDDRLEERLAEGA